MNEHTESSERASRRSRPTQAERRARTREHLLEAAYVVFVRRGFAAASLDEIAEAAGLSKGALYYNFAGKEDLFLALVEQRLERRAADLTAGLHAARAELRRAAEQGEETDWARAVVARLPLDRDWTLLFFEFVCHAAREPHAAQAFAERLGALRTLSARALEQLAADARFTLPAPAAELADALSALANGAAIEALLAPDPEPARELLMRTVTRILRSDGA
jgi:AcrR family transcriptional regulator